MRALGRFVPYYGLKCYERVGLRRMACAVRTCLRRPEQREAPQQPSASTTKDVTLRMCAAVSGPFEKLCTKGCDFGGWLLEQYVLIVEAILSVAGTASTSGWFILSPVLPLSC